MQENDIENIQAKRSQSRYLQILPGFIHNINSPLMNISGRVELIELKYPEIGSASEILRQLDRVNNNIDSLRYVIELERSDSQNEINLASFFLNFHKFLLFHVKYKHHLQCEYDISDGLSIKTSPRYLVDIFYEICLHCIENAKQGSQILIKGYQEDDSTIVEIQRVGNPFSETEISLINDNANTSFDVPEVVGLMLVKYYLNKLKGSLTLKQTEDMQQYTVVF